MENEINILISSYKIPELKSHFERTKLLNEKHRITNEQY